MDLREQASGARRHPWEVARSRFFRRLIADHVDLATVRRVLDVGAGDGWFAQELVADLAPETPITCWDVNYRSADLVTPEAGRVERTAQPPAGAYDLVLLLDVLEHVTDPPEFLAASVLPRLEPDGVLVVSVPAHPRLFSDHDRMLAHERRYRRGELLDLLGRHVDVRATGSLFTTLLVPRALGVAAERIGRRTRRPGVGAWSGGPAVTAAATAVLDADARVGRLLATAGIRVPGLSVWAVCGSKP